MTEIRRTIEAIVVFVDARGFTSWAEKTDIFAFIDVFGKDLQDLIADVWHGWTVKHLGDGAMLIRQISKDIAEAETTETLLKTALFHVLSNIRETDKRFLLLCKKLSMRYGSQIPLELGWGITKGHIKRAGKDFIGADINKSARLCSIARPHGIVIDRDDFPIVPSLPKKTGVLLYPQIRKLKGIPSDVNVWVTKEIATQFVTRENLREIPEVHVAGLCIKEMNGVLYCLIAKRASFRQLYPDLWEGCGGQLAKGELFATGVERHYERELNIKVEVKETIHKFYHIQPRNEAAIPGIAFLCVYRSGEPKSINHSEVKWVPEDELRHIPEEQFIKGVKLEFSEFISAYKMQKETVGKA